MSKFIYSALLAACLLSVVPEALSCEGEAVTLRGVVQETKDGVYVDGVLIEDSAWGKGKDASPYIGKKVTVKGIVRTEDHDDPNEGKDPSRDPMVQARVGTWKVMEKVESILIVR